MTDPQENQNTDIEDPLADPVEAQRSRATLYAHAYRSGEIIVTRKKVLHGAILVGSGGGDKFRSKVSARSRMAYNGDMLVPGIPEADTDEEALEALQRFTEFLKA